ncbi:DUF692 family multinuclear iron-containing protein [Thermicanus aegyptius]|uniref:multinuclear nonheme iron-dependent oxidase n=1 Tax=Thermicanus aegyptius TaxID=94009 RepID=UPI00146FB256|nr:DUF692 family multinuclear iron-containing protein [Thermicanus aegyptius]
MNQTPQLGCNYSPQLLKLLNQGEVQVDWIKLSRWEVFDEEFQIVRPYRPILLHVLPRASLATFEEWDWERVHQAIEACGSPHIALHFHADPADWETPPSDEEILSRLLNGVKRVKENLPVPLIIENVPYYGLKGTLRLATDPEIIGEVCERMGVGLLLDLAHLRVAAWHRKEDPLRYLDRMPLAQVREIHVTGSEMDAQEGLRDRHLEMKEEDYALLEEALKRCQPEIVTLEYGGTGPKFEWRSDLAALRRQLLRLMEILNIS